MNSGTPEHRYSKTQTLQNTGTPEHRHSRTQVLQNTDTPEHRHSRTQALQNTGTPEHRHSRTQALQYTGTPEHRHSRTQALQKVRTRRLILATNPECDNNLRYMYILAISICQVIKQIYVKSKYKYLGANCFLFLCLKSTMDTHSLIKYKTNQQDLVDSLFHL